MNQHQATDLAMHCHDRWKGGPPVHIWEEDLAPLNHARARQALNRIKHSVRFPSQALSDFIEAYNELARQTSTDDPRFLCVDCRGSGSIASEGWHGLFCGLKYNRPCICSASEPCHCMDGQRFAKSPAYLLATGKSLNEANDERNAA